MKAHDSWSVMVVGAELEVNDLVDIQFEVSCNSAEESCEVLLLDIVDIWLSFEWLNTLSHELIDAVGGEDRLEVGFLVWIELWCSIQVDAQTWYVHNS